MTAPELGVQDKKTVTRPSGKGRGSAAKPSGAPDYDDVPPPPSERRGDTRFVTVFRLAKLVAAREEFCLIRNISSGGVKAEVFSSKAVGERLTIDFGDERQRAGQVIWIDGDFVGIVFDEKIDVAKALEKVPPPGRQRARPIRLLVEFDAVLVLDRQRAPCHLIDISQGGIKLRTAAALHPRDEITLEISGLGKIGGVVRWVRDGAAGIAFDVQLPYRALANWIGSRSRIGDV